MINLPVRSERISDIQSVLISSHGEDFQKSREKWNVEFIQGKAGVCYISKLNLYQA